jgi:hypothetical protein
MFEKSWNNYAPVCAVGMYTDGLVLYSRKALAYEKTTSRVSPGPGAESLGSYAPSHMVVLVLLRILEMILWMRALPSASNADSTKYLSIMELDRSEVRRRL